MRPPGSSRRRKTRTTSRTSATSNSASTTAQSTWSGSAGPGKSEKASSGPISYASSTSSPAARSATVEMSVGSRGKPNSPPPFSQASTSGGHFSNSVPTGTSVHGASSVSPCASAIWRYEVYTKACLPSESVTHGRRTSPAAAAPRPAGLERPLSWHVVQNRHAQGGPGQGPQQGRPRPGEHGTDQDSFEVVDRPEAELRPGVIRVGPHSGPVVRCLGRHGQAPRVLARTSAGRTRLTRLRWPAVRRAGWLLSRLGRSPGSLRPARRRAEAVRHRNRSSAGPYRRAGDGCKPRPPCVGTAEPRGRRRRPSASPR